MLSPFVTLEVSLTAALSLEKRFANKSPWGPLFSTMSSLFDSAPSTVPASIVVDATPSIIGADELNSIATGSEIRRFFIGRDLSSELLLVKDADFLSRMDASENGVGSSECLRSSGASSRVAPLDLFMDPNAPSSFGRTSSSPTSTTGTSPTDTPFTTTSSSPRSKASLIIFSSALLLAAAFFARFAFFLSRLYNCMRLMLSSELPVFFLSFFASSFLDVGGSAWGLVLRLLWLEVMLNSTL
mmetsp:Transcript_80/g.182  ORF Transcript_80/g.182 Transcript_80/m.182 type:complete len:242 (+) Transcript_80:1333-2058(+)